MMMRAGEENSSTHSKKRLRTHFESLGNKKRMCQYGHNAKPDDFPSLMERAHMCSEKKYIPTERQQLKLTELEYDPPKMNAYLWPRGTLSYYFFPKLTH